MSQIEKKYTSAGFVILALTLSGCGAGFSSAGSLKIASSSASSNTGSSSSSSSLTGTLSGLINSSAIATAISSALQVANSLASHFTLGTCSGSGPSSQMISANDTESSFTLTSQTNVTYSAASCSFLNSNQLTLAPTVAVVMNNGENINVSANASNNYLGQSVGGGVQIGYSVSSLSGTVNILGLHSVTSGSLSTDISVRSTTPIAASVSMLAPYFTLSNDGAFVVDDNTDSLSLHLTASGLVWNGTCGCPVGGSLSGTLSGSVTGPVSVTYGSTCGSVTLTALGVSTTTSVAQCNL